MAGDRESTIQDEDFAGQNVHRAEECNESETAESNLPGECSVEKRVETAQGCNEHEGNYQGEDAIEQPTDEAAVTTVPCVEDVDDSDPPELPANLNIMVR